MPKIVLLFFCILMFRCHSKPKSEEGLTEIKNEVLEKVSSIEIDKATIDSVTLGINFKPTGHYTSIIDKITSEKPYFNSLYAAHSSKALDSASKYIYSKLLNEIVPHWYGTPWDFNGHTNSPNEGEIACGYFVSNHFETFRL